MNRSAEPTPRPAARQPVALRPLVLAPSAAVILALTLWLLGCGAPPTRVTEFEVVGARESPALRGTIGTQATLANAQPLLVSGIGFVVGLNGTGGGQLRQDYRDDMIRWMALNGISASNEFEQFAGVNSRTPEQLLRDPNTAVVLVFGVMPPGAARGTRFDVHIRAENASSLEGGTLWTTELRRGTPRVFGDIRATKYAEASGPIFVNPFSLDDGTSGTVNPRSGRVLEGGVVTDPLAMDIRLDRESHELASMLTFAINSRFPRLEGDEHDIARGRSGSAVSLIIPRRWQRRSGEFVRLVEHLTVDQQTPELYAARYARELRASPYLAEQLSWALQALGEPALPFIRPLYNDIEMVPRLAAIRAGAALSDPQVIEPLFDVVNTGPMADRPAAIRLLARVEGGPRIDLALREQLDKPQLAVRVAAYEGLVERAVQIQRRRLGTLNGGRRPGSGRLTPAHLDVLAEASLPGGLIQGVSRALVANKLLLDRVPFGEPLIYITQQGVPRIALFGPQAELRRPLFVVIESQGMTLDARSEGEPIRLFHRSDRTGQTTIRELDSSLIELIDFLARKPMEGRPNSGLDLTYSDIVGILYEIQTSGAYPGAFATEQNRLVAELLRARDRVDVEFRPERADDEDVDIMIFEDPASSPVETEPEGEAPTDMRRFLIPTQPPQDQQGAERR